MSVSAISSINSTQNMNTNVSRSKHSLVKYTGYAALSLGVASGIAATSKKFKSHKYLAYASGIFALIHTVLVEVRHRNKK